MTIIDRHVLRQALGVALVTILIGLLVLSAARFLIIFDMVLGNDQGMLIVARLLGAFVPHYLAYMLPLAIYWGSYSAARRMTVTSQVPILQATRSSIARSFRSLIVLGLLFAAINVAVVGWLQPLGRYTYRALTHRLETADFYLRLREGTFMKVGPRTILVDTINPDRRSFEKVFIQEALKAGGSLTIVAEHGEIIRTADELSLRLRDGRRSLLANGPEAGNMQMMRFAVLDVPVGNAATPFRPRGDDEQELLLPELLRQTVPLADASVADISANTHKRLVIALSCLFLPLLAVVLGVQSARKRNIYQSIIAVLAIVIYHQLVEFAGDIGRSLAIGPAGLLWLTYGVFSTTSVVLFYKVSTGIGTLQDRVSSAIGRWNTGRGTAPAWRRGMQTP